MEILLLYLIAGLLAGFLAGLLGIGGGLVLVPVLIALFTMQDFPPGAIMPLALGTSLATIVFTSVASTCAHHAKGAVDWRTLRHMTPGIIAGALGCTAIAACLSPTVLKIIFASYSGLAATQLVCNIDPPASRQLPGPAGLAAVGGVVGGISVLAGVGGAITSIPFLIWCNVPARVAIGTASAIGFPIAVAGSLGYIGYGLAAEVPSLSLGFVHLPALGTIAVATVLTAPLGARASHRLPVPFLKRALAAVLYATTLRLLLAWA
ncbi:MAG TPA: sulfite exporter TauE/SafE family protein [Burkholderiales bacterium]|nr:sulfite exporter TauE/SafE family protein [Burkholderiales bacterium]